MRRKGKARGFCMHGVDRLGCGGARGQDFSVATPLSRLDARKVEQILDEAGQPLRVGTIIVNATRGQSPMSAQNESTTPSHTPAMIHVSDAPHQKSVGKSK